MTFPMDEFMNGLQQMMTQLFLIVFILIILLFMVWVIFEFYPKWRKRNG